MQKAPEVDRHEDWSLTIRWGGGGGEGNDDDDNYVHTFLRAQHEHKENVAFSVLGHFYDFSR